MILPIYAFGQPVLKKVAKPITADYPDLKELLENMWETMYNAQGVGLAAHTDQLEKEDMKEAGIKQVFINAQKIEEAGEPWDYEEGCLSIPNIRGDVQRPAQLKIRYMDENFVEHEKVFTGINARVIQHEYDHIDGILFTELLKPIKRRFMKRKLEKIKKGRIDSDYRMKFVKT